MDAVPCRQQELAASERRAPEQVGPEPLQLGQPVAHSAAGLLVPLEEMPVAPDAEELHLALAGPAGELGPVRAACGAAAASSSTQTLEALAQQPVLAFPLRSARVGALRGLPCGVRGQRALPP